jgi:hypothetical protein
VLLLMTRATLDLDPAVLAALHRQAEIERRGIGEIASEALARALPEPLSIVAGSPAPIVWINRDLGLPFVNLEDG